ncbi:MAG: RNase adapter RapZ [Desulfovibrionaceae bacterium]|nr:RNase adapter RapZ [Desulfovibrionaceae bacterium]MBF0514664.1 RNase adapter RapZ [Desulfovibrionaceae bacterium]
MSQNAPGDTAFPVIILTGLSGAGKSTGLRVFEDMRFFCVDGLPASLAPKLVSLFRGQVNQYRGLALGMDVRQTDFEENFTQALRLLQQGDIPPQILFFEADASELVRRYSTTRRPHPLESSDVGLEQALRSERDRMAAIREAADLVINTTHFSIHDLRRMIQEKWAFMEGMGREFKVHVMSFGFKYGLPSETDLLFDLRFLPNPYFVEALRPLSGKAQAISEYVLAADPGKAFLARFMDFLLYLLPLYVLEGRYRLTVALGCTGGRHRSVAVAEAVFDMLKKANYKVSLEHRHIDKD